MQAGGSHHWRAGPHEATSRPQREGFLGHPSPRSARDPQLGFRAGRTRDDSWLPQPVQTATRKAGLAGAGGSCPRWAGRRQPAARHSPNSAPEEGADVRHHVGSLGAPRRHTAGSKQAAVDTGPCRKAQGWRRRGLWPWCAQATVSEESGRPGADWSPGGSVWGEVAQSCPQAPGRRGWSATSWMELLRQQEGCWGAPEIRRTWVPRGRTGEGGAGQALRLVAGTPGGLSGGRGRTAVASRRVTACRSSASPPAAGGSP